MGVDELKPMHQKDGHYQSSVDISSKNLATFSC